MAKASGKKKKTKKKRGGGGGGFWSDTCAVTDTFLQETTFHGFRSLLAQFGRSFFRQKLVGKGGGEKCKKKKLQ